MIFIDFKFPEISKLFLTFDKGIFKLGYNRSSLKTPESARHIFGIEIEKEILNDNEIDYVLKINKNLNRNEIDSQLYGNDVVTFLNGPENKYKPRKFRLKITFNLARNIKGHYVKIFTNRSKTIPQASNEELKLDIGVEIIGQKIKNYEKFVDFFMKKKKKNIFFLSELLPRLNIDQLKSNLPLVYNESNYIKKKYEKALEYRLNQNENQIVLDDNDMKKNNTQKFFVILIFLISAISLTLFALLNI